MRHVEQLFRLFSEIGFPVVVPEHVEYGENLRHVDVSNWSSIWLAGGRESLQHVA